MLKQELRLRSIQPADNPVLQLLFQTIVQELNILNSEYLSDPNELNNLYALFSKPQSRYLVVEDQALKTVFGGGGYAPLPGTACSDGICELQKMYLARECRGKGVGKELLGQLIDHAKQDGYRVMYLETVPIMQNAIQLYQAFGFKPLTARLGNTGHNSCSVFMTLSL